MLPVPVQLSLFLSILAVTLPACGPGFPDPPPDLNPTITPLEGRLRATHRPPSPTPLPLLEPAPTLESICPTKEETNYIRTLTAHMTIAGETSDRISRLFSHASEQPALFLSENWVAQMEIQLTQLGVAAQKLEDLRSPNSMPHIHETVSHLVEAVQAAVQHHTYGLDNLDPRALEKGNELMAQASIHTVLLVHQLQTLCDAPRSNKQLSQNPSPAISGCGFATCVAAVASSGPGRRPGPEPALTSTQR